MFIMFVEVSKNVLAVCQWYYLYYEKKCFKY